MLSNDSLIDWSAFPILSLSASLFASVSANCFVEYFSSSVILTCKSADAVSSFAVHAKHCFGFTVHEPATAAVVN